MAERVKYEQWLDDLEAKKDSTPTKVFDRVRQDYLTRLQTVSEQLAQHTATLQEHAANLVAKLRELESNEEAHTEEQAEAGLRKQVGEITSAEWDSSSKKAQRELAKIKENQELIAEELNQIRDILEGGGDDETEEDSEPRTSKDFNEMEFLSSVVGPTTGSMKAAKQPQPKTPTPAAGQATVTEKPAQPPAPPAPAAAPPPASEKAAEAPAAAAAAPAASAPAAPAPPKATDTPTKTPAVESGHAIRTSGVVEQPKTLKCQECGAMNYPSEWYCERCGAEMAVV